MSGHHDDSRLVDWTIPRRPDGRFVLNFGNLGEVTFPDWEFLTAWMAEVLREAAEQEQAARARNGQAK